MHRVKLASPVDFEGWRDAARRLALAGVLPEDVAWAVDGQDDDLFAGEPVPPISAEAGFSVPRRFIELARTAICHGDPERFALLYALLRGVLDDRGLIEVAVDPLVARVERMAKAVRRDIHKMHAFVRFRSVQLGEEEHFIAWFEPEHHIVEAGAPFFQRRFASMGDCVVGNLVDWFAGKGARTPVG